ncbi:hypothetical protein B5807_02875 [Epicoccum nigrum]|uniref:Uncharacterized protein n=1 Tax=Epicoccum nigrum TaxID=105696 RepID=A0A1Y2M9H9_EPING|nr:hypothetical protein B5807_02875 [Epicoccum nigrum]
MEKQTPTAATAHHGWRQQQQARSATRVASVLSQSIGIGLHETGLSAPGHTIRSACFHCNIREMKCEVRSYKIAIDLLPISCLLELPNGPDDKQGERIFWCRHCLTSSFACPPIPLLPFITIRPF